MTTSEILRAARARLTPKTWAKSLLETLEGKDCCLTAIANVKYSDPAFDLLRVVTTGRITGYVNVWNDAPERTLQDVYDAFDAAIAIAEQQEQPTPILAIHEPGTRR